jgi:hypothetical protein
MGEHFLNYNNNSSSNNVSQNKIANGEMSRREGRKKKTCSERGEHTTRSLPLTNQTQQQHQPPFFGWLYIAKMIYKKFKRTERNHVLFLRF